MSGGHYEYKYFQLDQLADYIESDFVNEGRYNYETTDYSTGKTVIESCDRIGDATEEQRSIILKEIKSLVEDLRKCSIRAKELEWYMSGDTGANSYLERLKEKGVLNENS